MLRTLSIRDFVIVERLDLEFGSGFTVLTGETGAGKSILIDAPGRSRAFVNGTPVTLAQLREAGEFLVDIHGQHEHQSLLRAAAQRALLDAYGELEGTAARTTELHRAWRERVEQRVAFET